MNQFVQTIAGTLFVVSLLVFLVVSIVLSYHWSHYNMRDPFVPFMQVIYFLGGCLLLGAALLFIL